MIYTVWMVEKSNITVSNGVNLNGVTQGVGTHLVGQTITFTSNDWVETFIDDEDINFEDNDGTQALAGAQTIDGTPYASGTRVEAEYRIIISDGTNSWTAYAYNVNDSTPAYATIEGLVVQPDAFGNFPPVGVPLTVTFAAEGPSGTNPYTLYDQPPCFTPGTLIDTPTGPRRIETLLPGDLVVTRDNGPQTLRWMGKAAVSAADLRARPQLAPVCIPAGALGDGLPRRDLVLSPQHRILFSGWRAEVHFAEAEVLVPALGLVGDLAKRVPSNGQGIDYLHLLFDRHEIIFAEGAAVESLLPAWLTDATLPPAVRAELALLCPDMLAEGAPLATASIRCLSVQEARLLA